MFVESEVELCCWVVCLTQKHETLFSSKNGFRPTSRSRATQPLHNLIPHTRPPLHPPTLHSTFHPHHTTTKLTTGPLSDRPAHRRQKCSACNCTQPAVQVVPCRHESQEYLVMSTHPQDVVGLLRKGRPARDPRQPAAPGGQSTLHILNPKSIVVPCVTVDSRLATLPVSIRSRSAASPTCRCRLRR